MKLMNHELFQFFRKKAGVRFFQGADKGFVTGAVKLSFITIFILETSQGISPEKLLKQFGINRA